MQGLALPHHRQGGLSIGLLALLLGLMLLPAFALAQGERPLRLAFTAQTEVQRQALLQEVAFFREVNPDVELEVRFYPRRDYLNTVSQLLDGDSAGADVLLWHNGLSLRTYAQRGWILPLQRFLSRRALEGFPPNLSAASSWQGQQYLLPLRYVPSGLYYNRSQFEREQLSVPQTFDELLALCPRLQQRDMGPIAYGGRSQDRVLAWFDALDVGINGAAFHRGLLRGQYAMTDTAMDAVFRRLAVLRDSPCFAPREDIDGNGPALMLADHRALESLPEDIRHQMAFAPFPRIDGREADGVIGHLSGLVVSRRAAGHPGVPLLLRFFSQAHVQARLTSGSYRLPAHGGADIPIDPLHQGGRRLLAGGAPLVPPFEAAAGLEYTSKARALFSRWWQGKLETGELRSALEAARDTPTITIAADPWCPHNCEPESDHPGYMIEIAREVFSREGVGVHYRTLAWARALDLTRRGEIEAVVGALHGDAPGFVYPQEPQGMAEQVFLVKKGSEWRFSGIDSLRDQRLGVINGYAYSPAVDRYVDAMRNDSAHLMELSGPSPLSRLLTLLQRERVDVVVEDRFVIDYLLEQQPALGRFRVAGSTGPQPLFIAFSPRDGDSARWARILSRGTQALRAEGTLQTILSRYGLKDWYAISR
ncbi:extracellular solute-binding protein [Marinobacteraceae bacterium S3BR75-40.1]